MLGVHFPTNESDEERGPIQTGKSVIDYFKIKNWLGNKNTGEYVMKTLMLGDDASVALKSSKLNTLVKYVTKFNKKFPNERISLIDILSTRYGDDAVAKAIVSRYKKPSSANEFVLPDLRDWFKYDISMAMTSSRLEFFSKYTSHFNEKFRDRKMSLVIVLTSRYGDIEVAQALASAKTKEGIIGGIAKQLWGEQQTLWQNSGKSVDDVFTLLKIRDEKVLDVAAKKVEALDDYARFLNDGKTADDKLVSVLSTGFGGEKEWARAIEDLNLDPVKLMSTIFKDDKGKALPTSVIAQYKAFYTKKM
ncbi:hypothetical protein PHMEG_00013141 [Phytophthora megakarya]|uniref:RxLR effector protein n=1 Tax=Phytophthora megakarya TaxID=4795 RepID=A0A225W708_9STRA|nr:hypothetical protein PHMEG_00013141 [Phytophthora megakarya]